MKKYWGIITVLLAVGLAVFFYFRFYFVFGEGVKSGELNYVVYKGLVFKTYEGKLIQTGIRSKAAGSIQSYEFEFSVEDEALARDAAGRKKDLEAEIGWIEARRDEMLAFWEKVEQGVIPTRVTHNDTKINNILFDRQGRVLCVIDLDTVLRSPCFNDFGDAIRTYANHGREDDENLDDVWLDMTMFRGFAEGYLSEARAFLTPAETDALAFSVRYITYEQVLRFLMDYLDGDTYYKIKSPDHNLVRTRAQYALLRSAEERYDAMRAIVAELAARP